MYNIKRWSGKKKKVECNIQVRSSGSWIFAVQTNPRELAQDYDDDEQRHINLFDPHKPI